MDEMIATPSALIAIADAGMLEPLLRKVDKLYVTEQILKEIRNHMGVYVEEVKQIEALISAHRIHVIPLTTKELMPIRPLSNENGMTLGNNSAIMAFRKGGFDVVLVYQQSEEQVYRDNGVSAVNVRRIADLRENRCGITRDGWIKKLDECHHL